jgi:hydroxymethylpyrimidine pyrophosphatase-like HAD family hydrolase
MKLSVIALDYDGTIARDGVLDPAVREAIGEVRRQGVAVVMVTGRRLNELHALGGALTCFDAIVGENGAVAEFPLSGRRTVLGHRPSRAFVDELRARGIPIETGECVIEADARWAGALLDVIRAMEQPLILAFNRGRVMVLPQAVGKSTGLRHALFALRMSIHNAIGIGDAENDHDLLDACEVGAAVAWGSATLRAVADEIVPGTGPSAVAAYIRRVAAQPRLSARQMGRRQLALGREHNGDEVRLAVRGRNIVIGGEPGTGKSWLAGLICEQSIMEGYCLCIIDPEGDYRSLEELPGVITLGGDDPPPRARELARALRHPDVSIVIDLSRLPQHEKKEYVAGLLPLLVSLRRSTGLPHKILLDESHYFLSEEELSRLVDPELGGYIFVTYRVSELPGAVRSADDTVVLVTRETDAGETGALLEMCHPAPPAQAPSLVFGDLHTTEAALLPGAEEAHGRIRRFLMAPRLTEHVRHREKYMDMTVGDAEAFVFTAGGRPRARARSLKEFSRLLPELPPDQLAAHLGRHDFSRWIEGVFRDRPLARHLHTVESYAATEDVRQVAGEIAQAIRARYGEAPQAGECGLSPS